jgi:hypothetical protein
MAGRFISTSCPVLSFILDPLRSTCLSSKLQQTPTWSKINIDIWNRHLLRRYRSIGATEGQMLKCQWWLCGSLVCTICYQVPCSNGSKNEVLSITWFVIFVKFLCICISAVDRLPELEGQRKAEIIPRGGASTDLFFIAKNFWNYMIGHDRNVKEFTNRKFLSQGFS